MAGTIAQGVDTYCVDALVPGRLASGIDVVAQRLYHRLTTPPGALRGGEDEADFGMDLAGYIGSIDPTAVGFTLPARVENELRKDPSVDDVTVIANRVESGGEVSWDLSVSVATVAGPLTLIMSASDVTVALLGVS